MKKICLVCDLKGWAFDIIAHYLKEIFFDKYDIRIKYFNISEDANNFFDLLEENDDCDLIHFFWRKSLLQFDTEIFENKVKEKYKDVDGYIKQKSSKISTGVYDFLYLKDTDIELY